MIDYLGLIERNVEKKKEAESAEVKKGCEYCQGGKCICFDDVDADIVVDAYTKGGNLVLYFEDGKRHLFLREINRPILYCPMCGRKL